MISVNEIYKDLSVDMSMAWNKDVAGAVGFRAVKNSLLGIVTTRKGDRPFMPEFGCDISDQLFENMTPLTADTISRNVYTAVRNYEPRISRLNVDVQCVYDDNTIIVTIQFSIVDNPDTIDEIKLQLRNR